MRCHRTAKVTMTLRAKKPYQKAVVQDHSRVAATAAVEHRRFAWVPRHQETAPGLHCLGRGGTDGDHELAFDAVAAATDAPLA